MKSGEIELIADLGDIKKGDKACLMCVFSKEQTSRKFPVENDIRSKQDVKLKVDQLADIKIQAGVGARKGDRIALSWGFVHPSGLSKEVEVLRDIHKGDKLKVVIDA